MIHSLHVENLLSFGQGGAPVKLGPLNVLIGPNGSGKSNVLSVLRLLRGVARARNDRDNPLTQEIRRGGGIAEWLWKGIGREPATLAVTLGGAEGRDETEYGYHVALARDGHSFVLVHERLEWRSASAAASGLPFALLWEGATEERTSSLAYRAGDEEQPGTGTVATWLSDLRIYDDLPLGRFAAIRQPQPADLPNRWLLEDGQNLGLVLNRIRKTPAAKTALLTALRDLFEGVVDYDISVEGGTVQVFLQEERFVIPASRLSDGTLRWLCLLAVLLDPLSQGGLICLEEPEVGLHPDLLPRLARLLITASSRSQLVLTTHSDVLVDALNDVPEAILICEKQEGQTRLQRLEPAQIKLWLAKYTLGQLWRSGQIGGNRW